MLMWNVTPAQGSRSATMGDTESAGWSWWCRRDRLTGAWWLKQCWVYIKARLSGIQAHCWWDHANLLCLSHIKSFHHLQFIAFLPDTVKSIGGLQAAYSGQVSGGRVVASATVPWRGCAGTSIKGTHHSQKTHLTTSNIFYHLWELDQSLPNFFLKDPTVNTSTLQVILATWTTTQLCSCMQKKP